MATGNEVDNGDRGKSRIPVSCSADPEVGGSAGMHHDIPMEGNSFFEVKFLLGTGNSSAEDTWVQHEEVMLLVASALSPIWECHVSKQT